MHVVDQQAGAFVSRAGSKIQQPLSVFSNEGAKDAESKLSAGNAPCLLLPLNLARF